MQDNRFSIKFDERAVDAIFSSLDQSRLPGGVVGIALDGQPVYRKGFGLASIDQNTVLAPTTRARIASISKHFVCAAYMMLCDQGRAEIDDSIDRYVPEINPASSRVTMRHLMSNTSGLRDVHDLCYQFSGIEARASSSDLLSLYKRVTDVNAEAGSIWMYNNGAYLLLSVAIERITGCRLEEALREQIFEPVQMYDTALHRWGGDFVTNCAALHAAKPDGGFERVTLGPAFAGEGGLVSTVDDMLRWLIHMNNPILGSAQTWQTMMSPQTLTNGVCTHYAMGLVRHQYRGVDAISHPGGFPGVSAYMVKVPIVGLDAIVMLNRDDMLAMSFVDRILDACIIGLDAVETEPEASGVTGTFISPTTGRVVQLHSRAGCQTASIDGGEEMPMKYEVDGRLRMTGTWRFVDCVIVAGKFAERSRAIFLEEFGSTDKLVEVEPPHNSSIERMEGNYQSDATGIRMQIYSDNGVHRLSTSGVFGSASYRLEAIAKNVWRMRPLGYGPSWLGGVVASDGEGAKFRVSTSRTRSLVFERLSPSRSAL